MGDGETLQLITNRCSFAGVSATQEIYGTVNGADVTFTSSEHGVYQGTFQGPDIIQISDGSTWTRQSTSAAATRNAFLKRVDGGLMTKVGAKSCADISGTWTMGDGETLQLITNRCSFAGVSATQEIYGTVNGADVTFTSSEHGVYQGTFQGPNIIQISDGTIWTRQSTSNAATWGASVLI